MGWLVAGLFKFDLPWNLVAFLSAVCSCYVDPSLWLLKVTFWVANSFLPDSESPVDSRRYMSQKHFNLPSDSPWRRQSPQNVYQFFKKDQNHELCLHCDGKFAFLRWCNVSLRVFLFLTRLGFFFEEVYKSYVRPKFKQFVWKWVIISIKVQVFFCTVFQTGEIL